MTAPRTPARAAAPAPAPLPLVARSPGAGAAAAILAGGGYGALLFGGAVSLLHLLHNRVDGVRDALAIWIFFGVFGGIGAAGATAIGSLLRRGIARDRNRGVRDPATALGADLTWGLALLHCGFFIPFALFGLTYDEVSFAGPPRGAAGMIALLVVAALVIAIVATLASRLVAHRLAAMVVGRRRAGSLRRFVIGAFTASAALHLVAVIGFAVVPEPAEPVASTFRPLRADDRASAKVVVVGLDGADWRVLGPMVERGEAPTFARLMREGAWGPLATLRGENSATMWASIYTGKTPRQHGVLDFYRTRLPGMSGLGVFPVHRTFFVQAADVLGTRGLVSRRIADRSFLRTRPLWEILDDLGSSVGVVDGYHFSVPARPLVTPGGFFFSYALNALSSREDFRPESLDAADLEVLVEPPEGLRHYAPHRALPDFDWQAATLLDAIATEGQPDFLNLYSHEPDAVQHQRWKWYEPDRYVGVDPADLERWQDAIPERHRAFDRFLATLVDRLDPDTTLLVVSDHGHSPTLIDRLYTQHRHGPPGIVVLWGAGARRGVALEDAHLYDVTPTVLHLLGLPVGADMAGRVLLEALAPQLAEAAVRTVPSYDAFGPAGFDASGTPDLSAEELERLRALGYL